MKKKSCIKESQGKLHVLRCRVMTQVPWVFTEYKLLVLLFHRLNCVFVLALPFKLQMNRHFGKIFRRFKKAKVGKQIVRYCFLHTNQVHLSRQLSSPEPSHHLFLSRALILSVMILATRSSVVSNKHHRHNRGWVDWFVSWHVLIGLVQFSSVDFSSHSFYTTLHLLVI